jgi:hypothetical protein
MMFLLFCNGQRGDAEKLHTILDLFGRVTGMQINARKSTLSVHKLEAEEMTYYHSLYPYEVKDFDAGLKYLGFHIKLNYYKKEDWSWLLAKLEKRLKIWSFRWFS